MCAVDMGVYSNGEEQDAIVREARKISDQSMRKVYEAYPVRGTEFFKYLIDSGDLSNMEDVVRA